MTISLAFLAPDLVKAAVEGRLPRGIGMERLRDAPDVSGRQRKSRASSRFRRVFGRSPTIATVFPRPEIMR